MDDPVLALDIGGTKLAAGLVVAGRLLTRVQRPTPRTDVWDAVRALLDEARQGRSVRGVGIGCGGPGDLVAGTVSPLNIPDWREFPLRRHVREHVPDVPVELANDAICVALAEHHHGAGRGHDDMLGVVVSTGVGGGLVSRGRIVMGRTGNAGHIGHVVVDPDGPGCECGGRGCVEAISSGPRLLRWAVEQGWDGPADGRALAEAARRGHPVATAAYERAGRALGLGLASAAAVCDIDLVVVGGGVSATGPLLLEPAAAAMGEYGRLEFLAPLRLVAAELGQDAGLVGAAALVA